MPKIIVRVRMFDLLYDKRITTRTCGVYLMVLGDKNYVGRSYCIWDRMRQHKAAIEILISKHKRRKYLPEPMHYLSNVFTHVQLNKDIKEMKFYLLDECEPLDIVDYEQKWLDYYVMRPGFLNLGSTAKPSPNDFVNHAPRNHFDIEHLFKKI